MTNQRIIFLAIAMITLVVSSTVFTISQFSRVFADIQCEWGRKAMEVFISIAPFTGAISLFVVHIHVAFFVVRPAIEAKKLVVQTLKYVIYKGAFVLFVVPPTHYQARVWSGWVLVTFSLKMYLDVFRERLEQQLNASPSATPWTYSRFKFASVTYFTLLVLLTVNLHWISLQMMYQTIEPSPVGFLLFFAPLSIATQTLHAILVHGFQLIDIWIHHLPRNTTNSTISDLLDIAVGLIWERMQAILPDVGFLLDIMSLLMSLGHYVSIWKLHGMTVTLFDAMLFLPILSLLSEIVKRTWKFITLWISGFSHLHIVDIWFVIM